MALNPINLNLINLACAYYFLGAVKITPAHDHNDYGVGQRHNLPFVTMIDDSGNIKNLKDYYPEFQHFAVSCLSLSCI